MPKQYSDQNVYNAAIERIEMVYRNFDDVYFSFSAGKDSTCMLHLALEVAHRLNKCPVKALLIDLEGQYKSTIEHATQMLTRSDVEAYWICLPLNLRNAVSQYQSQWMCWDPEQKDTWIREMPQLSCVISDEHYFPFYRRGMEFEEFDVEFGKWLALKDPSHPKKIACGVGIRSQESLNRFRTIANRKKIRWQNFGWSTQISETPHLVNFYPIYDWNTEDDWTYIGKNHLEYNKLYDLMYLQGRSIHDMRICQPYGDDQRKGLDLFHQCEPETWFKVVNRVSGANMGSLYRVSPLLGHNHVELPKGQTWKNYAILLLESMPKYEAEHYLRKIRVFLRWWAKHGMESILNIEKSAQKRNATRQLEAIQKLIAWAKQNTFAVIPDENDSFLEAKRQAPSWRRIVKCLMKNDRLCKSLSFAQCLKTDRKEWEEYRQKYPEEFVFFEDDETGEEEND